MTTRLERSFRGISERLVVRYLTNLGGEQVAPDTVAGEGWTATFSSETVDIGPTLTLTEITIIFESDEDELESDALEKFVERFAQKAMRAGG